MSIIERVHETGNILMKINLVQRARLLADQLRRSVDLAGHLFDPLPPLDKLKLQMLSGYRLQIDANSDEIAIYYLTRYLTDNLWRNKDALKKH